MDKRGSPSLQSILSSVRGYYPDAKHEIIEKAYRFADDCHKGQLRSSGEPYIIHPTEVAQTLADLKMDVASIAAALLHDTLEDTAATSEQIEKEFGKDILDLVEGVTKLSKMTFRTTEEKQAENFRKMVLAMSKDIRVILVKLADRLNNMRTLEFLPPHKQKIIASETLDIYAPIANRLGMGWLKAELEDLCLRYLHSEIYYKLAQKVAKKRKEREKYIEEVHDILTEKLKEYDMASEITGRAKHFYSIYKKMERDQVDFDQIYDALAFRILVDNITECYKALGVIHATYKPVPGRFKDYIAMPKANGYQSLHTTVIGPFGERVEIQIRTHEMNLVAERGIAAHWKYKEGRFDSKSHENVEWVNRLLEWGKDLKDPAEFLETVKIDLFAEDVFVFTPAGEVKDLPYGSTPLDFAYAVHTDVGHRCLGAKVNGKIVPLKYKLRSGDTIEVLTGATQTPSKDWLKIAKTSRAKAKIRAYIKLQERERAHELGKELLEKTFKSYGATLSSTLKSLEKLSELSKVFSDLGVKSIDELYVLVGYGRTDSEDIAKRCLTPEQLEKREAKPESQPGILKRIFNSARKKSDTKNTIRVANLSDVLIRFGRCCNPLPGDSIVGFITRGRGVTIHTATCNKALDSDSDRRVDVHWQLDDKKNVRRHVKIRILSLDEPGLLALMSQAVASLGVNITSANIRTTKDKKAICLFDIEVTDIKQLQKVAEVLESKKGVLSVERVKS